ncbi:MAG: phage tail tape measure protein [Bacteroidales bacterium]|nr:phage tail tape measure protein [Candidatus Scybalousia scybalohippi]
MAGKKIGAKIVLDGEAEFRSAVRNSQSALKALDSELKLTSAQFKNQASSMEALKAKQSVYVKQQEQLTKQEKLYVDALKNAQKQMDLAKNSHSETAKNIEKLKDALEKAKTEYGENSTEAQKLTQELEEQQRLYSAEEKSISNLENKMNNWTNSLNQTRTELAGVNSNLETVNKDLDNFDNNVDDLDKSTQEAGKDMEVFGDVLKASLASELIVSSIKTIVTGLKDMALNAIDAGMAFEASMSNVEALSGASGDELQALSDKAKEMGASTMYSASQAADAFGYMALAGWNVDQMLSGIEPVLSLAAASNMDLAQASDIVTDSLTAFGLKAEDAGKLSDMMAYAMANSNTSAQQLGEAYKNVAATAGSMGISVEEVTAVLSTMANAGVKGSEAGTALNAIMTRLATDTKGCATELAEFGVEVYDSEGNMKSLTSILEGCAQAYGTLTQEQQASLSKMIAGTSHYSAFQTIMAGVNASAQDGAMGFADYKAALESCDGAASSMADTMQNNLQGKLTIMQSALEGLKISFYDVFDETLKNGVDGATDAITRLNQSIQSGDMGVSLERLNVSLDKMLTKMIDWAEKNLPKIIDGLADIIDNAELIGSAIAGIVTGLVAFKVASSAVSLCTAAMAAYKLITEGATVAQIAMNIAADANPYVLLASALIGVATAVALVVKNIDMETSALDSAVQAHVDYMNTLESERAAEEETKASRESEKATIEQLENELLALNEAETLSNAEQARMRAIVDELNQAIPDLNLALDEQGRLYGGNNEILKQTIDSQKKLLYLQYAQEDLNAIAKKQYDLQKDYNKTLQEQAQVLEDIQKLEDAISNWDGITKVDIFGDGQLMDVADMTASLEYLNEVSEQYNDTIKQQEATMNGLDAEYQQAMELVDSYSDHTVSANATHSEAVATSTAEIESNLAELEQAYADAKQAALDSINEQVGLFDELSGKSDLTIEQMKDRFKSQADVYNQYSSDMEKALKLLEAGAIDNDFLSSIESMGLEGAGYLHELVESAQNDSETFKETMQAWSDMEDAKNQLAEQTAEMQTDYTAMKDELIQANEELATQVDEKTAYMLQTWQAYGANVTAEMGNQANQARADGQMIGNEGVSGIEGALGIADGKSQKAYDLGLFFAEGFAEGISEGTASVEEAASMMASIAETAVRTTAGIHSPSTVARNLGEYFGEGFNLGMEDTLGQAKDIIRNSIPNEHNMKASGTFTVQSANGSKLDSLYEIMATYLPGLANSRVEITANAKTEKLFEFVVDENRKNTKRTGNNFMVNPT